MSNFKNFADQINRNFSTLQGVGELFVAPITGDELYAAYLAAFPEGTNPLFRERTEHDCSNCRGFIKNFGPVVRVDPETLKVTTVWDGGDFESPYDEVAEALAILVWQRAVQGPLALFRVSQPSYSAQKTTSVGAAGFETYHHFYGSADRRFVTSDGAGAGEYATSVQVLSDSLERLTPDAVATVRDLIEAGSLYRGAEHLPKVKAFQALLARAATVEASGYPRFIAVTALNIGVARFKNSVIGTLVEDLASGMDLEAAVRSFEQKVAPQNYQRTAQLVTQKMIDDALAFIEARGLNVARRMAKLDDVSVNNVLWSSGEARPLMKGGLAAALAGAATVAPRKVQGVTEVSVADFLKDVMPGARSLKVLVEPALANNFMTLTTSDGEAGPQLFKWRNPFAWSYTGGTTDMIQERVKAAGGKIDAALRVSLSWHNSDDLDLHMSTSRGEHIYFGCKRSYTLEGGLDVDMNAASVSANPVENIALGRLPAGTYEFSVHNYRRRGSGAPGFTLQLATPHQTTNYTFAGAVSAGAHVYCLRVMVDAQGEIKVQALNKGLAQAESAITGQKWGLTFGEWADVHAVMKSPNHWDGEGVGNEHTFFILQGARTDEQQRGIYNEYLHGDLAVHRKVFDVIGERTKPALQDDQLSGVGVSSTLRKSVTVQADGRTYRVNF